MKPRKKPVLARLGSLLLAASLLSAACPIFAAAAEANTHALHSGPSDLSVVTAKFQDGDTVRILEYTSDSWTRIALEDGTIGYCDSALLSIRSRDDLPDGDTNTGETLCPVAVLSEAEEEAPPVGILAANVYVSLLSAPEAGAYTKIATREQTTGYIPSDAIQVVQTPLATVVTRPALSQYGAKTEVEAKEALESLSLYFEDGRYWNSIGSTFPADLGSFCITDTPCAHTYNGYAYCNTYAGVTDSCFPEYGTGSQCLGYASLISDLVFGTDAPISVHYDLSRVRVGDHIRLRAWEHSMIVTETGMQEDGQAYIRVTEVNADYENCQISWGRTITQNALYALGDTIEILTRYEN